MAGTRGPCRRVLRPDATRRGQRARRRSRFPWRTRLSAAAPMLPTMPCSINRAVRTRICGHVMREDGGGRRAAPEASRERHRRRRVKALTRLLRWRCGPAGDTAPSASRRLTMAGRRLPAISGPAGRTAWRTSRTGTMLPSIWCACWRTVAFTWGKSPGWGIAAPGGGERPRSMFAPRIQKRGDCGARFRWRSPWICCGQAPFSCKARSGRGGDRDRVGGGRAGSGTARGRAGGTSDGGFCKEGLASDRCLSLGRR